MFTCLSKHVSTTVDQWDEVISAAGMCITCPVHSHACLIRAICATSDWKLRLSPQIQDKWCNMLSVHRPMQVYSLILQFDFISSENKNAKQTATDKTLWRWHVQTRTITFSIWMTHFIEEIYDGTFNETSMRNTSGTVKTTPAPLSSLSLLFKRRASSAV